jgi:hypothetical protein
MVLRINRNSRRIIIFGSVSIVHAVSEDITIIHALNRRLDPQCPSGSVSDSESIPIVSCHLCLLHSLRPRYLFWKEPGLSGARAQSKEPE